MSAQDTPGRDGEERAARFLEAQGCAVIARNFRCRAGELDLVARDGDTTVFVEVKQRRGPGHGAGVEAVTAAKRRRLVSAARIFASRHGLSETRLRFDVISIDWHDGQPRLRHDRGAFDAGE